MSSQSDRSDCELMTDCAGGGESDERPGKLAVNTPRRVAIRCLACISNSSCTCCISYNWWWILSFVMSVMCRCHRSSRECQDITWCV